MFKKSIKFNILFIVCLYLFNNVSHVLTQYNYRYVLRFKFGEYGSWTPCSRSCGIGVQQRTRKCYDNFNKGTEVPDYYCGGNAIEYKTCNLNPCPSNSIDFRTYQCEQFNSQPQWGRYYKWKPFLDGGTSCNLLCMPKDHNFFRQLAEKVVDGTNCGYDAHGICVNGECKSIGCDGDLNSTKMFDKCGKCGGDNLSCNLVSGMYLDNHVEKGYYTVTVFPRGAKYINVTEYEVSDNFLALKTESGINILNTNSNIEYSGIFYASGTEIQYYRRRIIMHQDRGEAIFIKGPINEPLVLQVLYQHHNPGIVYYYSLDFEKSDIMYLNKDTLPGRMKVKSYANDYSEQNDYFKKSKIIENKNEKSNQFQFVEKINNGNYVYTIKQTDVTKTIAKVTIPTKPLLSNTTKKLVPIKIEDSKVMNNKKIVSKNSTKVIKVTTNSSLSLGKSINDKNRFFLQGNDLKINETERYMWFVAGLTPCSAHCGGGYRHEIIRCLDKLNGKIVNYRLCKPDWKPSSRNFTCNTLACSPSWEYTDWSQCSSKCGNGTQHRSIKCVQKIAPMLIKELSKEACQDLPLAEISRTCMSNCTYWKLGSWQNCQVTCGRGARLRTVTCVNEEGKPVSESLCKELKPSVVDICDMGSCAKVWFYSEWSSSCEKKCDLNSYITRRVVCGANLLQENTTSNGEDSNACDAEKRPISKKACKIELEKCKAKWFAGPWSECSASCDEGTRTRSVICLMEIKGKFVSTLDSHCNPKEKPTLSETCFNEPCKSEWYMSDWSECSKTCDTGVRTREIKCLSENYQASLDCDLKKKPHFREYCLKSDCPQAEEERKLFDTKCKDKLDNCYLIKHNDLCIYYKNECCKSCQ